MCSWYMGTEMAGVGVYFRIMVAIVCAIEIKVSK